MEGLHRSGGSGTPVQRRDDRQIRRPDLFIRAMVASYLSTDLLTSSRRRTLMTSAQPIPWKHVVAVLLRYSPFWLGVTLLCGGLGFAYAQWSEDQWEASQPLLVRDEANGSVQRLGKFASQTELIAAQETLVEMARNYEVVEQALQTIGPPPDLSAEDAARWPSLEATEFAAKELINLRAPKTSEFGKSEVVYLTAKAGSQERARKLCAAMLDSLSKRLRQVRQIRADSIVAELKQARVLARENLDEAVGGLRKLEESLGMDLGELRGLSESVTAESYSQRILDESQRDVREADQDLKKLKSQLQLVRRAKEDPQLLAASDGDLLKTQPTLQRLIEGMIDAQLEASKLAGRLTPDHPRMVSARLAEQHLRQQISAEIDNVMQSLQPQYDLAEEKYELLVAKQTEVQTRLTKMASIRTDYARLIDEVDQRTTQFGQAETALAEAEASRSAALTTNLISPLGPPRSGEQPVGLSRNTMTAGALFAGLMMGLGGVFLVAPGPNGAGFGRRWNDQFRGRRASDQAGGGPAMKRAGDVDRRDRSTRSDGEETLQTPTTTPPEVNDISSAEPAQPLMKVDDNLELDPAPQDFSMDDEVGDDTDVNEDDTDANKKDNHDSFLDLETQNSSPESGRGASASNDGLEGHFSETAQEPSVDGAESSASPAVSLEREVTSGSGADDHEREVVVEDETPFSLGPEGEPSDEAVQESYVATEEETKQATEDSSASLPSEFESPIVEFSDDEVGDLTDESEPVHLESSETAVVSEQPETVASTDWTSPRYQHFVQQGWLPAADSEVNQSESMPVRETQSDKFESVELSQTKASDASIAAIEPSEQDLPVPETQIAPVTESRNESRQLGSELEESHLSNSAISDEPDVSDTQPLPFSNATDLFANLEKACAKLNEPLPAVDEHSKTSHAGDSANGSRQE